MKFFQPYFNHVFILRDNEWLLGNKPGARVNAFLLSFSPLMTTLRESCKQGSRAKEMHRCQEHTDTLSWKRESLSPNHKGPVQFLTGIETFKILHRCDVHVINTEIGRVNAPMPHSHWAQQSCLHPGTITAWSQRSENNEVICYGFACVYLRTPQ